MTATGQDIGTDADPYYAGDTLIVHFSVTDRNGDPKDLTGASVEWAAARSRGDAPVLSDADTGVSLTIDDASGGVVRLEVDRGVTDDLHGPYHYELEVTDSTGSEDTVTSGKLKVTRDIA